MIAPVLKDRCNHITQILQRTLTKCINKLKQTTNLFNEKIQNFMRKLDNAATKQQHHPD
jgi:pterin-4a-carbinolamine dehydratase